jgi:hypothetical protein
VHVATALVNYQSSHDESVLNSDLDRAYLDQLGLTERLDVWRNAAETNLQPQTIP